MPDLHLGVTPWLGPDGEHGQEPSRGIASQARTAEALGYRSFWLPESHFLARGAYPAPLISLASAAAVTSRLQLGTVSLLLPIRQPLLLAEEVAVLDRLSGGRVVLGVGRGFRAALFRAFGVPVGEKRDRFESHLRAMVSLWRAGDPGQLSPEPDQRPHPPIWVAAFGPKALAQAAKLRLCYLASPLEPLAALRENYRQHAEMMAAADPNEALDPSLPAPTLPVPIMRSVFVSEDRAEVEAARAILTREALSVSSSPSARLRGAASSPLEERVLIGAPDEVRAGIERYRSELAITHLIVRSPVGIDRAGLDQDAVERSLALLATMFPARPAQTSE